MVELTVTSILKTVLKSTSSMNSSGDMESVAYTDQPENRFNNTTVLIQHSKWSLFLLNTCLLPNKETPNMDIHYIPLQLNKDIHNL